MSHLLVCDRNGNERVNAAGNLIIYDANGRPRHNPFLTAEGGTGQISNVKGDLLAGTSGSNWFKLTVGANGQIIVADSAQTPGLRWTDPPVPASTVPNPSFETWENGVSAAPDNWSVTGASATVAREGTIVKLGAYSAKLTRAGTDCHLSTDVYIPAHGVYTRSRTYTFGAWVYATVASRVRLRVNDGVTTTNSAYHSGGSAWEWLQVTFTTGSGITALNVGLAVDTGDTSGYIDGATLVEGQRAGNFQPQVLLFNQMPRGVYLPATLGISNTVWGITIDTAQVLNHYYVDTAANANDGDTFTWGFWLAAGTYTVQHRGVGLANSPLLDWYLDGELVISGQDWYTAATTNNKSFFNSITVLGDGYHVLQGVVNGKNGASTDFRFALSFIEIHPSAY